MLEREQTEGEVRDHKDYLYRVRQLLALTYLKLFRGSEDKKLLWNARRLLR